MEDMQRFWSIRRDKISHQIGDCSLMTMGQPVLRISSSLTLESKIKEIEMLTNPVSKIFITLAVLAAALVSISFVNRSAPRQAEPNAVIHSANAAAFPDFYQRHPEWKLIFRPIASIAMTGYTAFPDYAQRHPELSVSSVLGLGASDYFQRHSELTRPPILGLGASDYFMRHPELTTPILGLEASDYFQRHPDLTARSAGTSVDLTDYYFRHSEVRKLGRSMDLTDYFVRHPELTAQ
jgi:hypothetical protein